jgi:parallel beta-helix repeat protein
MQAKNIKPKSVPVKRAIALSLMPLTWGLVTTIGLASLAALTLAQTTVAVAMRSPVQILVVNPGLGNDTSGNGSESTPFKTITQALRVAQPNTVILLVPATYSTETGESFPLILKTGVTLQGNPRSRGQDIVIKGGGSLISPTSGEQNITIVGADRSGVTGITITNPNPRGSGLWIESGSPVVVDNTFTGNTQDGISIHGNSATLIRSNYFYDNGGNGITISGTSRPDVRDNVLANKGLGIRVTENATPSLTGNRISNNQDGVVVEANAQPLLRNNIIENNQRYGLVAIARSQPDLGTKTEPGGNVFRGNGQFDISNQTQNLSISAFGNQLSDRTEGVTLLPQQCLLALLAQRQRHPALLHLPRLVSCPYPLHVPLQAAMLKHYRLKNRQRLLCH